MGTVVSPVPLAGPVRSRYSRGVRRLGLIIALCGCNAGVEGTSGPGGGDASTPGGGDAAEFVRYRGTLANTQTVPFGGSGFCDYTVVLQNVELDVVLREASELAAMSIEDTMTEAVVGSCPYTPEPPSRQVFSHDSKRAVPTNADGNVEPMLTGATANRPMTKALALVTVQNASALSATVRWERTDQGPPLKWIVATTAPIALQPQTCTPNANVCVGGTQGTLYKCEDGMKMSVVRLCTAGCAANKTACN